MTFLYPFSGIFIPETRRFFLSSHSGIWKVCRYAMTPIVLGNVSVVRNFSVISFTNPTRIDTLKKNISQSSYIQEFLKDNTEKMQNSTEINETLRKVLFATWVTNDDDFATYRDTFQLRTHDDDEAQVQAKSRTKVNADGTTEDPTVTVNPTDIKAVKEIVGGSLVPIVLNNTNVNVLLPEKLSNALFDGWQEKGNIIYLLSAYAKALNISPTIVSPEGKDVLIRPPRPPKKSKCVANGYEYRPFSKFYFFLKKNYKENFTFYEI